MLANLERTTACELSGLPNTIRWFTHLADPWSGRQPRRRDENVLEALLHDQALCAQTCADDHPSFVVEIAENHLQPLSDLSKRVRYRGAGLLECDICSAGGRRICGLDRLGFDVVGPRDKNDNIAILTVNLLH